MLKLIATAALSCMLAGTAFAQSPSPAAKLTGGTWVCSALNDGLNVISRQSYAADGTSTMMVMAFGKSDGMNIRVVAEGVGTWNLVGDRLDEVLTRMTATYADIGGEEALEIAQNMLDGSMVNVTLTNTATFAGPTLQLVDVDDVVTDCAR
jgi:phosphotransferase system HPr-like phosphotransfer protein